MDAALEYRKIGLTNACSYIMSNGEKKGLMEKHATR